MKLAARYNRASLIVSISILLVGSIVYYIAISYFSNNQIDRSLKEEIDEVIVYVANHQRLPKPYEFDENQAIFTPVGNSVVPLRFTDTPFYESQSKKTRPGRAVIGMVQLKGINYQVVIAESKESTQYLVQIIGLITSILTILLLIALFFTNRYVLRDLWKPFYQLLQKLKSFDAGKPGTHTANDSRVDEFRELGVAIDLMSERVSKDYQSLRTFTENASHEIMTPLAVITSKLDNLIQDETLNAEQFEQLQDIYNASSKLSRLNQSLLLLVKIDNNLINDTGEINLKLLIDKKLNHFQEILHAKDLIVNHVLQDRIIFGNPYLIDILLNNLLSNAIRHNITGGQLRLELNAQRFVISNTSNSEALNETLIFERFQKGRASEGLGLGLTIARNICDNYGYLLTYRFDNPFHCFIINFNAG
jgi:signal transduction histidine kinase